MANSERLQSLMVETLMMIPLFAKVNIHHLQYIACYCQPLVLNEGDIVISETESPNQDLYALLSGQVEVLFQETGATSSEIVISNEDTVILGEISWLCKGARTATVRCTSDVETIRIDGAQLANYLEQNPDAGFPIMYHVSQLLAKRLISSDTLLKQLLWNLP